MMKPSQLLRRALFSQTNTSPTITTITKAPFGRIWLTNPSKFNALSHNTIKLIRAQLAAWERDPAILAMALLPEHPVGTKKHVFSAGADIHAMYEAAQRPETLATISGFFRDKYALDLMTSWTTKPYIPILDGLTLGGGSGLSLHSLFCVATERTRLGFPEANIGYFPDVGTTYCLSRIDGGNLALGLYLALTGTHLTAKDCLDTKLVSYGIESTQIKPFMLTLQTIKTLYPKDEVNALLQMLMGRATLPDTSALDRQMIAAYFDPLSNDVNTILARLKRDEHLPWCKQALQQMQRMSPCSLRLTEWMIRHAAILPDLEACMVAEQAVSRALFFGEGGGPLLPEFIHGTARALKKPMPDKWPVDPDVLTDAVLRASVAPVMTPTACRVC